MNYSYFTKEEQLQSLIKNLKETEQEIFRLSLEKGSLEPLLLSSNRNVADSAAAQLTHIRGDLEKFNAKLKVGSELLQTL